MMLSCLKRRISDLFVFELVFSFVCLELSASFFEIIYRGVPYVLVVYLFVFVPVILSPQTPHTTVEHRLCAMQANPLYEGRICRLI